MINDCAAPQQLTLSPSPNKIYSPTRALFKTYTNLDYDDFVEAYSSSDSEHDIDLREPIHPPPQVKFDEECLRRNNKILLKRHSFFSKPYINDYVEKTNSKKKAKKTKNTKHLPKIEERVEEKIVEEGTNPRSILKVKFFYESDEDTDSEDSSLNFSGFEQPYYGDVNLYDDDDYKSRIFNEALVIPPRRIHGYKNVAQYLISRTGKSRSSKSKKTKRHLQSAEYTSKFSLMLLNEQQLLTTYGSAEYWWNIMKTPFYENEKAKAIKLAKSLEFDGIISAAYLLEHVFMYKPNDVNINQFKGMAEGWEYTKNPDQPLTRLPLRYAGQNVNFYEPFVIRSQKDDSGRKIVKEGLCPYCPIDVDHERKFSFNNKFFNLKGFDYAAHLGKYHGVYASGNEMPMPTFVEQDEKVHYICTECHKKNILNFKSQDLSSECIIEFFKHCMARHYHKKIPGLTTKQFTKTDINKLLYPKQIYSSKIERSKVFDIHRKILNKQTKNKNEK